MADFYGKETSKNLRKLRQMAPDAFKGFLDFDQVVFKDGAIPSKTKELMAELKRQNFHGAFCVEYEYHWENSSPEIAQCVKFWNDTCAELAAAPISSHRPPAQQPGKIVFIHGRDDSPLPRVLRASRGRRDDASGISRSAHGRL